MQEREDLRDASMEEVYEVANKQIRKGGTNREIESALVARGVNQNAAWCWTVRPPA